MSSTLLRPLGAGTKELLRRFVRTAAFALPLSLTATVANAAQLTLAWDASPSPSVTGYYLYVGTTPGAGTRKIDVGNSLSAMIDALVVGKTYYISVSAHDAAGIESPRSNEVQRALPFGDFDFDGKADILWRNTTTGSNQLWQMNGLTRTGVLTMTSVGSGWNIVATGDADGDGKTDLFWRNADGRNRVWLMDGAVHASTIVLPTLADTNWEIIGSGDFNGDGSADLFWRNMSSGEHQVWLLGANGLPTVVSAPASPPTSGWSIAAIGDADGDGKADLFWRNANSGSNYLWKLSGGDVISVASLLSVPDLSWEIQGSSDFDGDGKSDLIWRNKTTGELRVWLMDGAIRKTAVRVTTVDPTTGWDIAAIRDIDGDGKSDLVWRNISGSASAWTMNAGTVVSQAALPTVSDSAWAIVGK